VDVRTLAEGLNGALGFSAAWGSNGVILFIQPGAPIQRIADNGGTTTPALPLDRARGETGQRIADFLPDGKHFLYTSTGQRGLDIYEGSLDGSKPVLILPASSALAYARPPHSDTGYLLYYHDGQIHLRPFDPGSVRVSGATFTVGADVTSAVVPNMAAFLARTLGSI
jgi:hypothetical protein